MGNYGNGSSTRQAIVDACMTLFYEKGYRETSYSDICKLAHVDRSTIYYHFDAKEELRYEVLWEYTLANKRIAERYCDRPEYHYMLANSMMWHQLVHNEKLRKFHMDCYQDCPFYTGKMDNSYYYGMIYQSMWGPFWDKKNIPRLSYASVYGYLISCIRMLCENPDGYDPMALFVHCLAGSAFMWGIPNQLVETIVGDIMIYTNRIPQAYLEGIGHTGLGKAQEGEKDGSSVTK